MGDKVLLKIKWDDYYFGLIELNYKYIKSTKKKYNSLLKLSLTNKMCEGFPIGWNASGIFHPKSLNIFVFCIFIGIVNFGSI